MDLKERRRLFLSVFRKAERRYGKRVKRLSAEGWDKPWQTLIATMLSAQSRDEVTIPIAERLFMKYGILEKLSKAKYGDVFSTISSINYNKTKARNVMAAAKILEEKHNGKVPDSMDRLLELPGVGRKTANLVLSEIYGQDTITIDTHCHRILNVLGIVDTKTPEQTEREMMKVAPRKYWSRINRIFVLWGKDVHGRDMNKLLAKLDE